MGLMAAIEVIVAEGYRKAQPYRKPGEAVQCRGGSMLMADKETAISAHRGGRGEGGGRKVLGVDGQWVARLAAHVHQYVAPFGKGNPLCLGLPETTSNFPERRIYGMGAQITRPVTLRKAWSEAACRLHSIRQCTHTHTGPLDYRKWLPLREPNSRDDVQPYGVPPTPDRCVITGSGSLTSKQ